MSTTPVAGTNYSSGDCKIKTALPPEGKYNYSVIIIPGEVQVLFNGSNQISKFTVFTLKYYCIFSGNSTLCY